MSERMIGPIATALRSRAVRRVEFGLLVESSKGVDGFFDGRPLFLFFPASSVMGATKGASTSHGAVAAVSGIAEGSAVPLPVLTINVVRWASHSGDPILEPGSKVAKVASALAAASGATGAAAKVSIGSLAAVANTGSGAASSWGPGAATDCAREEGTVALLLFCGASFEGGGGSLLSSCASLGGGEASSSFSASLGGGVAFATRWAQSKLLSTLALSKNLKGFLTALSVK